jgi:hypothetical protein
MNEPKGRREVLGETWRSWIPLVYASVTLVGGLVALRRRDGKGRRVLAMLFGAGIAVGLLGFWFHTDDFWSPACGTCSWRGASRSASSVSVDHGEDRECAEDCTGDPPHRDF